MYRGLHRRRESFAVRGARKIVCSWDGLVRGQHCGGYENLILTHGGRIMCLRCYSFDLLPAHAHWTLEDLDKLAAVPVANYLWRKGGFPW